MKKLVLICFFPLLIACLCLLVFHSSIDQVFFKKLSDVKTDSSARLITKFQENEFYENQFLMNSDSTETIFLLGSSELTINTPATPFNFITEHFKTKLIGVGHAGNQSFSIYSQLLANADRLKDAPVVIILSPGWFHSASAKGTATQIFLEFNSPWFLNNIIENNKDKEFKQYESKRIADFVSEISSPDLGLKILQLEHLSSKSIFHQCAYAPIIALDKQINSLKLSWLKPDYKKNKQQIVKRHTIEPIDIQINWDSLLASSKQSQLDSSSNNPWYINNGYYSKYTKGTVDTIDIIKKEDNIELQDFEMLLKLVKAKEVNASFIIIPLNPYYYSNAHELTPLMTIIDSQIKKEGLPCLNLWTNDTSDFDKGVLKDVMHISSYGWYQVDKFIVDTYHLAK